MSSLLIPEISLYSINSVYHVLGLFRPSLASLFYTCVPVHSNLKSINLSVKMTVSMGKYILGSDYKVVGLPGQITGNHLIYNLPEA